MKTLKQYIEENLNTHFHITREEQKEATGQWDETIKAATKGFKEWLQERQQEASIHIWDKEKEVIISILIEELEQ